MCLDTDEKGRHDRESAYKILLWDGPILVSYEATRENVSFLGASLTVLGLGGGPL